MTVQELITLTDSIYPNRESDTVKVAYMNIALASLAQYFGQVKEDRTLVTVGGQDSYNLPSGIDDVSQIIVMNVGMKEVPDNRYEYSRYYPSTSEDNPARNNSYWQIVGSDGSKKIAIYPTPGTDGLPIVIRYKANLSSLSSTSLSSSPDFDPHCHDMLAFYAVHMICSSGASPDRIQADTYMQKFDDRLNELRKANIIKQMKQRNRYPCNGQWIRYRSSGVGDAPSLPPVN